MADDIVRRPTRRVQPRPAEVRADTTTQVPQPPSGGRPAGNGADPRRHADERAGTQEIALRLRRELNDVLAVLPRLRDETARRGAERADELRAAAARSAAGRAAAEEQKAEAARAATRRELDGLLSRIAPGAAGAPASALPTAGPGTGRPTHVLAGTTGAEGEDGLPVVLPLWDRTGWYVTGDADRTAALALAVATRSIALFPTKHLGIHVFDARLTGTFGPLAPIRDASSETFPPPSADPAAFSERVARIMDQANRNAEAVGVAGKADLGDLWSGLDLPEGRREVIVVLGYPFGIDERLQGQLVQLAATANRSGVTLVICEADHHVTPARGVDPDQLAAGLLRVGVGSQTLEAEGYPPGMRPADPVSADDARRVVEDATARASSVTGPTIPLTRLLADDLERPWERSSASGLDVVVGESRRQLLGISLRTQNPPHPNLLIGGSVGTGKSNLLLDIIYSLAVRYGPDELEMHLLDFKQGLEFARFAADESGQGWLPHVKVLCLESDLPFGVAVLRSVEAELDRRSALFKASGVSSIDDFRAAGRTLPRLLLIIDEFHVLFEGDDELIDGSVQITSHLAKQGRAYGVHLILASQTISGIQSLATRGDSIFAQFPLRMSLKNTVAESQAILAQGNKAAADLTYRGEVVVNRNFGGDPDGSNILGTAAYAEPERMAEVQRRLWERGHSEPPMMFVGSAYAEWDDQIMTAVPTGDDTLPLVVGRPLAVDTRPRVITLTPDADQGVAVVGRRAELADAVLASMTRSALPTLAERGGTLVLLCCDPTLPAWAAELTGQAEVAGVPARVVVRDEVAAYLREELARRLSDRVTSAPVLLVGIGMQRARDMDAMSSDVLEGATGVNEAADYFASQVALADRSLNEPRSARETLQDAVRNGAMNGVHVIASWSTLRTMEQDLGSTYPGVGYVVTAGLGGDDLKIVAGVTARPPQGHPRVGCYDQAEGSFSTLVPYGVDDVLSAGEPS